MQLSKDFVGVLERAPCGYIKAPINEPAVLATGAVHYSRFVAANVIAAVRPPPPLTTPRLLITLNVRSLFKELT